MLIIAEVLIAPRLAVFLGGSEYEMPMSIFDIAKRETARYNENAIKQTGG